MGVSTVVVFVLWHVVSTCTDLHTTSPYLSSFYRTVRVKMLHTFLLSGGPHGRLTRGDELVEMEFRRGSVSAEAFLPSEATSP